MRRAVKSEGCDCRDMTYSYKSIIRLVWPLALGMINNAVMQFVDRAYLAHHSMLSLEACLPASALAGVFVGFFQSVVGFSGVLVAQYHGAGDEMNCRNSYRAGMWIAVASGFLMLPLVPLGWLIFSLASPSAELFACERSYYNLVMIGSVFLFGQMAASSYFTGRGRTRLVFWVNLIGNLVNIALDPILIFKFEMGIEGAAIATVFSQLLQFVVLVAIAHDKGAGLKADLSPDIGIVRRILRFGLPAGGYEVLNMLSFTIFVFVTETVGGVEFAVSNACFTISYLLFAPLTGFALGAQTLVGSYRGAGDDAGAMKAVRRTVGLGLAFCALASVLLLVFNRQILGLFAPADAARNADFLRIGFWMVVSVASWMIFDALDTILCGALKGAGDTRFVFWWMLVCAFLVWMPLTFAVRYFGGSMLWLWSTMLVYVIVISMGSLVRWRRGGWKTVKVLETSI